MGESKPCCSKSITERTPLLEDSRTPLRRAQSNSVLISSGEDISSRDSNRDSEPFSGGRLRGLTSPPDVHIQNPNYRSFTGNESRRKQKAQRDSDTPIFRGSQDGSRRSSRRDSDTPVFRRSQDGSRRKRRTQRDSDEGIWINAFYSDLRVRRHSYRHEDLEVHDVQNMESSDVEDLLDTDVENICYDHFWSEWPRSIRDASRKMKRLNLKAWLCPTATKRFAVCAVIALIVPVVCILLLTAIDLGSLHKHNLLVFVFEKVGTRHNYMVLFLLLWVTANCFITFILFCISFSLAPEMTGSGVPELRAFISGACVTRILRWRTLVAKMVAVVGIGLSEMPLGVLEPMMHIGGLIGAGVSQGRASSFRLDLGIFGEFRIDAEKRLFATCGAAAAFACAFGSPISGVLFVMEYVSARWTQDQMVRTMWSSALSAVVAYIWDASLPTLTTSATNGYKMFGSLPAFKLHWFDVLVSLGIGCIGFLPATAFVLLNRRFQRARADRCRSRTFRLLEVIAVTIATSLLFIPLVFSAQPLKECHLDAATSSNAERAMSFACPTGLRNAIGSLVGQVPGRALKLLIHQPDTIFGPSILAAFGASVFFLSAYCYGTVMPGGIFIPSLLIGASWGRLLSHGLRAFLRTVAPSSAAFYRDLLSADKFALLGASAQLSGVLQAPLSISVMFAEGTGSMETTLFVVVAAMASKLCVQQVIEGNFYDVWSRLLRLPFLDPEPRSATLTALKANEVRARHIMSTPVTYVRCTDEVGRVLRILELSPHNGFPVVSGDAGDLTFGQLRGLIDRKRLLALIEHKNLYSKEVDYDLSITLNRRTFERPRPASLSEVSVRIAEEDMLRQVVVAEYMNLAPFVVQENVSYLRVYNLFFELGLRHLPVVNSDNELVGIITRKDLLRYRVHHGQLVECPFGAVVESED